MCRIDQLSSPTAASVKSVSFVFFSAVLLQTAIFCGVPAAIREL
jgi:hypothetical protein